MKLGWFVRMIMNKCCKISSFLLAEESLRKVRRTSSVDSADVILAAGESSKTDPTAFIEQQRQMLNELQSSKVPAHNHGDVIMRNDERTDSATKLDFQEDHFRNTPPNSALRDNPPITKQPGLSSADSKRTYSDFVHIEKDDYEKLVHPHESGRHGMLRTLYR